MKAYLPTALACLTFSHCSAASPANIEVVFQATELPAEQQVINEIKRARLNETVMQLSAERFPFQRKLTLSYGGEAGPLFDPDSYTIHIPYSFYQQSLHYFESNKYQQRFGKSARQGALETLLHTLLHEAGHAYVVDQNIPILGKEEDAVDNFATMLLIEYVEDGAGMAISAADMFAFESEDRPEYYDFGEYIDEHSFDLQRYFSTLCLVYGSDPKQHHSLLDELEPDYLRDRKEFCADNYDTIHANWHHYLLSE
ncbi:DUF4344 domain-containing metallopeptidase [Vibrio sp. CAU 1672]|uniref:DUF4344 domain-containing metallopeptidase n=1 Tax=Vibrio sp. CAU 1672 TaxID=3032594 RepID=UPI0023DB5581|nr:DUF4344 domain-containing metallopeptidase [Vibrio sp. CAU 1672]MDF2155224.1 DUF4344 domain-containing metallopeptidase [Vibrio sp. CAU 1672]